jgi:ABC-type dipeptide/oligopeptide/nickel transport system permease subunit
MTTQVEITPEAGATIARLRATPQLRSLYRDAVRRFVRNKLSVVGLVLVIILLIMVVFADNWFIALPTGQEPQPLLAKTHYDKSFVGPSGAFPNAEFWMGTDLNGRDLWSRIVYGARIALAVGLLAQLIAFAIGIPLGGLAGWQGGRTDFLIMRLVDVFSAIPTLLLAVLIMARLGAGFWNVMFAIGITSWITICRLTRAQFLSLREKEFIEASRMVGSGSWHIIWAHMLPNSIAPILVALALGIFAGFYFFHIHFNSSMHFNTKVLTPAGHVGSPGRSHKRFGGRASRIHTSATKQSPFYDG